MYDVNFGGIEHMTKRLTIALVAVALFVLLAVMPVSAVTTSNANGTVIELGATVFIGEQGLNLTHALNGAVTSGSVPADNTPNTTLGWWASAADITTTSPSKVINLAPDRYKSMTISQADFVGYTGNWYLLNADGKSAQTSTFGTPTAVINVQDPTLSVAVWDFQQSKDVTGMSITQGEHLGVQVNTNMYAATYAQRNNTIWSSTIAIADRQGIAPNGAQLWSGNYNSTNEANNSYVTALGNNMYKVYNFSSTMYHMTYNVADGSGYNTSEDNLVYGPIYFNASAAVVRTGVDSPWTGMNYTSDAAGLTPLTTWPAATTLTTWVKTPTAATDGFINLYVKNEQGAKFDKLLIGTSSADAVATSITKQYINNQPWYLGSASTVWWVTDALDNNNQYAYPVGTYSIWAESALNNMKDNYRNNGADYTGKTVSAVGTVTLVSDTVKIEANKDSVVRSKSFSVTVTGKPSTTYYVWVKDTSAMTGGYDDQPPMVVSNQEKVYMDNAVTAGADTTAAGHPIGAYQYENGAESTIWDNVAASTSNTGNKTRYYALINTSSSGTRTVEFATNNWTKAQKYTIRVEQHFGNGFPSASGYGAPYANAGAFKSDEVDVNVEKGAVTIVAAGDQSYYLGEEVKFSGTNTETYKTYLFLIGPNLPTQGAQIQNSDPRNAGAPGVTNNDANSFKVVDVNGDNTWSWKWGTANYALDAGTYTIYAVSQPNDKSHLANAAYGTVSIIIKKPFVSATASQSTVAKGDRVYITGTAEGDPGSVYIWIMGKNYATKNSASVNADSSFKYEVKQEATKDLTSGQYFVVVQHPMQNKQFDVDLYPLDAADANNRGFVYNRILQASTTTTATKIFKLLGPGSLQGSDAAEALAEGINNANVDDTYTKLQFLVEEPTITIDTIGDKHVGDKFTITAKTNLAVDDEILVQVYSSSFKPTMKSQSGEFSGASGTVKVTKGDSGYNKISFDVDSSTFKPDEYIVTEEAVLQTATGTALFNVLETTVKTVAPTAAATAVQTPAQTAVPTTVATAAPTAAPTKSPGFGALVALIGLGAVAFVVVRRH
jgi:PGF-CTERM protein